MLVNTDYFGEKLGKGKDIDLRAKYESYKQQPRNPPDYTACKGETSEERLN